MQKIALIPAYCPEDRMIDLLKKLSELNFSVLVIDDGSGENYDAIFNKASQYADVKRYQNNRGKGEALKYGLRCIAEIFQPPYTVVTADADGQHRGEDIVKVSETATKLMEATKASFFDGIRYCKVGYRLSDISHAVQVSAEGEGFSVIRDFVGHGVGHQMHEDPQIPNFGKAGRGPRLAKGMVFAIEPMICEGTYDVRTLGNDWTVVTLDGKLSAHYENTVVITDGEPELLTLGE